MVRSWKTSLFGLAGAVFLVIGPHLADPSKPWISTGNVLPALGVLGVGASAKDDSVGGPNR